jgi:hypothetical protein
MVNQVLDRINFSFAALMFSAGNGAVCWIESRFCIKPKALVSVISKGSISYGHKKAVCPCNGGSSSYRICRGFDHVFLIHFLVH